MMVRQYSRFLHLLRRFGRDLQGTTAMIFGLSLVPLTIGVGVVVDYTGSSNLKLQLQHAADTAALAAAGAVDKTEAQRRTLGETIFAVNYKSSPAVSPNVSFGADRVTVTVNASRPTTFMQLAGIASIDVAVTSVAAHSLTPNEACVLALDPSGNKSIWLDSNAEITAPNCNVHANSSHNNALHAASNSQLTSQENCVVGGYSGGGSHYSPDPTTGCPVIPDPLAGVVAPDTSGCDQNDFEVDEEDDDPVSVDAGVYCGGITVKGDSVLTFNPGTYVIKDGEMYIDSNSRISGTGVSFYFTGTDATIFFDSNTQIDLVAPSIGDQAGILFFEDRNAPLLQEHRFFSNSVSRLEGAIYLSRGLLWIDSNSQIGASSAFTTIVARRLRVDSNAQLVVNADYGATSVPVLGVGGSSAGSMPYLIH